MLHLRVHLPHDDLHRLRSRHRGLVHNGMELSSDTSALPAVQPLLYSQRSPLDRVSDIKEVFPIHKKMDFFFKNETGHKPDQNLRTRSHN